MSAKVLGVSAGIDPVLISPPFAGDMSYTKLIRRRRGGKLVLHSGRTRIVLKFPKNSVPEDTEMTLTLLSPDSLYIQITPPMQLNRPAQLRVRGDFVLPDGRIGLFHYEDPNWTWVHRANVRAGQRNGQEINYLRTPLRVLLNHFSRYAFGSRF